jgi:hypothetical protein
LKVAPGAELLLKTGRIPSQLSFATGSVHLTFCEQVSGSRSLLYTVKLARHPLITGGVLSITVTEKVQVAVFPSLSLYTYVTGVVPLGNEEPGA